MKMDWEWSEDHEKASAEAGRAGSLKLAVLPKVWCWFPMLVSWAVQRTPDVDGYSGLKYVTSGRSLKSPRCNATTAEGR